HAARLARDPGAGGEALRCRAGCPGALRPRGAAPPAAGAAPGAGDRRAAAARGARVAGVVATGHPIASTGAGPAGGPGPGWLPDPTGAARPRTALGASTTSPATLAGAGGTAWPDCYGVRRAAALYALQGPAVHGRWAGRGGVDCHGLWRG